MSSSLSSSSLSASKALLTRLSSSLASFERSTSATSTPSLLEWLINAQDDLFSLHSLQKPSSLDDDRSPLDLTVEDIERRSADERKRVARFELWLRKSALSVPFHRFCRLQTASSGDRSGEVSSDRARGVSVRAVQKVGPSTCIMSIPRAMMMREEEVTNRTPFGQMLQSCQDRLIDALPSVRLALYLVHQWRAHSASKWHAYIDALPHAFTVPMPLLFHPRVLLHCRHHPVADEVARLHYNIVKQYVYIVDRLNNAKQPMLKDLTLGEYVWAMSILTTRQNLIPLCRNGSSEIVFEYCLTPGFDSCNHSAMQGRVNSFFSLERDVLDVFSDPERIIEQDYSLDIFYGQRNNLMMFTYSGFVDVHNANRSYSFYLNPGHATSMAAEVTETSVEKIRVLLMKNAGIDQTKIHVQLPLPLNESEWITHYECLLLQRARQRDKVKRLKIEFATEKGVDGYRTEEKKASMVHEHYESTDVNEEEEEEDRRHDVEMHQDNVFRLQQLMTYLRIFSLKTKAQAIKALKAFSASSGLGCFDHANEMDALNHLHDRLTAELQRLQSCNWKAIQQEAASAHAIRHDYNCYRLNALSVLGEESLELVQEALQKVKAWTDAISTLIGLSLD